MRTFRSDFSAPSGKAPGVMREQGECGCAILCASVSEGMGTSFAAFDFEGWVVHSQSAGWPGFLVFTVSATPCIIHLGVAEASVNSVFEVRIRFRREGCAWVYQHPHDCVRVIIGISAFK